MTRTFSATLSGKRRLMGDVARRSSTGTDGLDGAVANVAQYAKLQAIQFEGYPSMEKLEEAIQRKVEAIHDTLTMISFLAHEQARAQKVRDTSK